MFDIDYDALFKIIVADLVLSGDNAVVIGMAARRLPPRQRRLAIVFGAGGAIGLRVLFTALVTLLLGVPLLQAIGGVLLIWIAFKLLLQEDEGHKVKEGANLADAVRTIILADVIMSFDNILAVGAAAHGNVGYLLFGLALSMPLILFGSGLISTLLNRLPWLAYLGSAVLIYAAVELILEDRRLSRYFPHTALFEWGAIITVIAAVLGLAYWLNSRHPGLVDPDPLPTTVRDDDGQPQVPLPPLGGGGEGPKRGAEPSDTALGGQARR